MAVILSLLLLVGMLGPTLAHADTVYFRNGESIWGKTAFEEGAYVVVVRPGGKLRFPKSQVRSVEPVRNTLPPHYSPPPMGIGAPVPAAVDAPGSAMTIPSGGAPAAVPAAGSASSGGATPTSGTEDIAKPTALPPLPPPPSSTPR
jgi:hypothetical protein